jgi:hypothetical protein
MKSTLYSKQRISQFVMITHATSSTKVLTLTSTQGAICLGAGALFATHPIHTEVIHQVILKCSRPDLFRMTSPFLRGLMNRLICLGSESSRTFECVLFCVFVFHSFLGTPCVFCSKELWAVDGHILLWNKPMLCIHSLTM